MTTTIKMNPTTQTNATLINSLKAHGFNPHTPKMHFVKCPNCERVMKSQTNGDFLMGLPSYNKTPAIVFKKNDVGTLIACRCGYRELRKITFKPMCPNQGCNVTLKNEGDRCYKCYPPTEQELAAIEAKKVAQTNSANQNAGNAGYAPEPTVKQCKVAGCTNPVPEAHFVNCAACRAANRGAKSSTTEGVRKTVEM